jgi:hypothetical protein
MGNKGSKPKPSCRECNCQSEVPRVIAACNNASNTAIKDTLNNSMTSLVGKENSNLIIKHFNSAVKSSGDPTSKWVTDYNKIKESFNNYEGFVEGNEECVPCDCVQAANEIIADCNKYTKELPSAATLTDKDIQKSAKKFFSGPINAVTNNRPVNNDWINLFYPYIKIKQTTMEGFSSGGLYTFTRDALASRHATFKNTATFETDCKNNSYNSITTFITEEKKILDSLYDYYLTFIKDYESLYLHKESFSKTIYNKLDELAKIQEKIDSYKTNLHLDNRKNLYQSNNYEFYSNIRFYMLIVYYSVLVLYLILSKFFTEKQYTNKLLVLLLFIYLIMPIILEQLINLVYKGYIYFLEYNNLKEDVKSYEDIYK